jgi:hypothetical protein
MTSTHEFWQVLERFESRLLSPVIPGELDSWLLELADAAELVGALMWRHVETERDAEYGQMARQDPELLPKVEQMKDGDDDCLTRLEALLDKIAAYQRRAPRCEPDEAVMCRHLGSLVEEGLAWVLQAKRQEKSRETWLMQAFIRDRGEGD